MKVGSIQFLGEQTRCFVNVPSMAFFTKGIGVHREKLTSFEMALRQAGIATLNLVTVSSIFPPECKLIGRSIGTKYLNPGQITNCVMARSDTNETERLISSSIGLALPQDKNHYGYLSEHHPYGETAKESGDYAEDLAAEMLSTVLGIKFDPDKSWDEKREIWKISKKIVETSNCTQGGKGKKGYWTTTMAALVFIP